MELEKDVHVPGFTLNSYHRRGPLSRLEHQAEFALPIILAAVAVATSSFVCHFLTRKKFTLGPHVVAVALAFAFHIIGEHLPFTLHGAPLVASMTKNSYGLLAIYYPVLILKTTYTLDSYIFRKSFNYIFVVSILAWISFGLCFSLTLLTFSSELSSISVPKLLLIATIFSAVETPSELQRIDHHKNMKVLIDCESVFSTILSVAICFIIIDGYRGMFNNWYQPICVILFQYFTSILIGFPLGLVAGHFFPRICKDTKSAFITVNIFTFALYIVSRYMLHASPGLACFLVLYFVSLNRVKLPAKIDKQIIELINESFNFVTNAVIFTAVLNTLTDYVESFKIMAVAISVALHICANVFRFAFYIIISLVMSRFGYRFNLKATVVMVWCIRKGPIPFLLWSITTLSGVPDMEYMMHLGLNYLLLMVLVNEVSSSFIFNKIEVLGSESVPKRSNVDFCFERLNERREFEIAALQMNRFYSNANWKLVNSVCKLVERKKEEVDKVQTNNTTQDITYDAKPPHCPVCKLDIAYDQPNTEFKENLRIVWKRVLHSVRVALVRHNEFGMLDSMELRMVFQAMEANAGSETGMLDVEKLIENLVVKAPNPFILKLRRLFNSHNISSTTVNYVPRFAGLKAFKEHRVMKWFLFILYMGFAITQMILDCMWLTGAIVSSTTSGVTHACILSYFLIKCLLDWLVCIEATKCDGCVRYLRSFWNVCDLLIAVIGSINLMMMRHVQGVDALIMYVRVITIIEVIVRILQCLRLIMRLKPMLRLQSEVILYCDRQRDKKLSHMYTMARAVAVCYEEVDDILNRMTTDERIVTAVRTQLQNDKNRIMLAMGMVDWYRAGLTMQLRTRNNTICTVRCMDNALTTLRVSGIVDMHEYKQIEGCLIRLWNSVNAKTFVSRVAPKSLFYEVSWIDKDEQLFEYFYDNVSLRVWDSQEVICNPGEILEGVIILITGMFEIQYEPNDEVLKLLANEGYLPVRDLITNARFDIEAVDYVFKGNSIGELSVLTGRTYSCRITAKTPCQAFIIPRRCIYDILKSDRDPVLGLYSRLWYHVAINLVKRILLDSPFYQNTNPEFVDHVIARSFFPKLDAYNVLSINELIEDVVLVEGTVVDWSTRELYIAPCYIPRAVSKLIIPDSERTALNTKPKLCLVPVKDIDEYEIMMYSEIMSDLASNVSSTYLLAKDFAFRKWQQAKRSSSSFIRRSFAGSSTLKTSNASVNMILRASSSINPNKDLWSMSKIDQTIEDDEAKDLETKNEFGFN